MNRHYFTLCILAIALILIPFTSKALAYTSAVYKVKPHHTTAVYEANDTKSLKLFHTKANRHVIVHNQTTNGWSYIQDGENFGYIVSTSLTQPASFTSLTTKEEGVLLRTIPSFQWTALEIIPKNQQLQTYTYNDDWHLVQTSHSLGYAPTSRLQRAVTLETKRYNVGEALPQKRVALTFDDGPNEVYTHTVLKTLARYNVKATFFVVGSNVKKYPSIARRIVREGHEIGSHTYSHPELTKITLRKLEQEMQLTNTLIEQATGAKPTVFRPPYGSTSPAIIKAVQLPTIMWSVDTLDWKHKNSQRLLQNVKKNTKNGSIILMHDSNVATQNGLANVIDYLQQNGYIIVTVSELLQQ